MKQIYLGYNFWELFKYVVCTPIRRSLLFVGWYVRPVKRTAAATASATTTAAATTASETASASATAWETFDSPRLMKTLRFGAVRCWKSEILRYGTWAPQGAQAARTHLASKIPVSFKLLTENALGKPSRRKWFHPTRTSDTVQHASTAEWTYATAYASLCELTLMR